MTHAVFMLTVPIRLDLIPVHAGMASQEMDSFAQVCNNFFAFLFDSFNYYEILS